MTPDTQAAEIARKLTKAQREAWLSAEWQGEYWSAPALDEGGWQQAKRLELVHGPDCVDGEVLRRGEHLIAWLKASWRKRFGLAVRSILMEQSHDQQGRGER